MIVGEVTWHPGMKLEDVEEAVIKKALSHYGAKTITAKALGISVRTLHERIRLYELREQDRQNKINAHYEKIN